MKKILPLILSTAILAVCISVTATAGGKSPPAMGYEVWASDQSNSRAGAATAGSIGSYLWIWDSADIEQQLSGGPDAQPLGCGRNNQSQAPSNSGPCDLLDVFPGNLVETDAAGQPTGYQLSDLNGFGRLHGMLPDPQNQYVTANIFAPNGGYVGIIDTSSKEAVALFRVSGTNVGGGTDVRSVHMSFWSLDGSSIIVANLNGKLLERIDVTRNGRGKIKSAVFNRSATLGVGKNMAITAEATVFRGKNAHGRKLIGKVGGDSSQADLEDLTPNGECKENDCDGGVSNADNGGRPNNVIICPIPSANGLAYVTMGGGGLLVADIATTPMTIVGEYGNQVINGAGCGGVQSGTNMWLNAGVSASGLGASQSTFTLYVLDDNGYGMGPNLPDTPAPTEVYRDDGNTATTGSLIGNASNSSGQLPDNTTRRDSHGMAVTQDGAYIHTVDRIQNTVTACDNESLVCSEYDLTSLDGAGNGYGACLDKSVVDDGGLPANDPAPDLLERTPDGKYLMIGLRGPRPVSVTHSAQGSCPGVGVVELLDGGASGRLVGVLRATNAVDTVNTAPPAGGYAYNGVEHSDVHAATVVRKKGSSGRR